VALAANYCGDHFLVSIKWYASTKFSWQDSKRVWLMISILLFRMIVVNTILPDNLFPRFCIGSKSRNLLTKERVDAKLDT
jgi:hypothetical protein